MRTNRNVLGTKNTLVDLPTLQQGSDTLVALALVHNIVILVGDVRNHDARSSSRFVRKSRIGHLEIGDVDAVFLGDVIKVLALLDDATTTVKKGLMVYHCLFNNRLLNNGFRLWLNDYRLRIGNWFNDNRFRLWHGFRLWFNRYRFRHWNRFNGHGLRFRLWFRLRLWFHHNRFRFRHWRRFWHNNHGFRFWLRLGYWLFHYGFRFLPLRFGHGTHRYAKDMPRLQAVFHLGIQHLQFLDGHVVGF